ncbi:CHAT domain-containing protein [Oscillatoria sp. FACHB-1407]|nr:CHAT domain-containing protein [Oscillatoria sp. FACHB-1407]
MQRLRIRHFLPSSWFRRSFLRPIHTSVFLFLFALLAVVGVTALPVTATQSNPATEPTTAPSGIVAQVQPSAADLEARGRQLYEAGQFQQAATVLQQAVELYRQQGDVLREAIALSNLTLSYQQLGAWTEANQAIATSLDRLNGATAEPDQPLVLAQVLDIQGSLQLAQGQSEQALATWEQAAERYAQVGDSVGVAQSTLNQAQALQALGLYRRAIATLGGLVQSLESQPDSLTKVATLRSLGDALRVAGDLEQSRTVLQRSLTIAQQLQLTEAIAETYLSLGNTARAQAADYVVKRQNEEAQADFASALEFYQQASTANSIATQTQSQLNQLSLLIERQQWSDARALAPIVQRQLNRLLPSRTAIYARINFSQSLIKLANQDTGSSRDSELMTQAGQQLAIASQQATNLRDERAEAYALGSLGGLYEQTRQWAIAQELTQKALLLSQASNASDIAYLWQWQLGRLLKAQDDRAGAIAAYTQAVNTLQTLRSDLVAINRDVQFSFREGVEPVYRQLVDLLLKGNNDAKANQDDLTQARSTLELLQIAELDNFFREACLDAQFQLDQVVDQANLPSAIIYPIILPDRLEVIVKLPQQQDLQHYTTEVPQTQVERTLDTLRQQLTAPYSFRTLQGTAQQVYNWLIRPMESTLQESQVNTLVFVLDGVLRNIPMAALFDGQQYLVQKYGIALAPGLQLFTPRPLPPEQLQVLVAGLSESRFGFSPLNYVETEVEQIQTEIPSQVLFNQTFTANSFQNAINASPFPVVHIATHGQFSSNADQTFILAWDKPINVNELNSLLRATGTNRPEAIELLVLSACQTATGDRRAALGLAGVAVRAGARSTLASLWSLDDESGAAFMSEFYKQLTSGNITRAEAVRQAQLSLLTSSQFRHPRYWAPYVLLGNWL